MMARCRYSDPVGAFATSGVWARDTGSLTLTVGANGLAADSSYEVQTARIHPCVSYECMHPNDKART